MIAAVSDLFEVWQLIPLAIILVVGVFGGGSLFFVGWRFIVKGKRATYWRAIGVYVVAVICGGLAGGLVSGLLAAAPGPGFVILGTLLGMGGGVLVTWAMISWLAKLSFGKAILAWLPTLGTAILVLPILMTILLPSLNKARDLAKEAVSLANLNGIGRAIQLYEANPRLHRGQENGFPSDLQALVGPAGGLSPKHLKAPGMERNGRTCDYFYLRPPAGFDDPEFNIEALMACAFSDCHRRNVRLVLYRNASVRRLTAEEFDAELAKPENAAFAAALRAEEQRLGIADGDE